MRVLWWQKPSLGAALVALAILVPATARHFLSLPIPHVSLATGATATPLPRQPDAPMFALAPETAKRFPPPPDPLAPGRSALVAESPFGLSIEYPLLERALGPGPCPPQALIATIRELGSPAIRVGGDSQDLAGPTAAYHYEIAPSFWTTLGCLARETGAQITVGLNFGTPLYSGAANLEGEQSTISSAEQAIPPSQLSFSLGNEPDLYTIAHIIPNEPGFLVPAFRAAPWTAARFFGQWQARRARLGPVRLEGPDLAGTGWRSAAETALRAYPPSQVDAHGYPTVAPCGKGGPSATAAHLLSIHASVGMAEKLSWLARLAHSIDRPAVISETNSASCGGRPGVSDAPVSGVWAIRYVIAALLAGFDQVRFHSAGTSYDPLVFEPAGPAHPDGGVTLRPLGRALLFLHRWLPPGARIVSISHNPLVLAVKVTKGAATGTVATDAAAIGTMAMGADAIGTPVVGVGTPVVGIGTPVVGIGTPVVGSAPVVGIGTPVMGSAPVVDIGTPVLGAAATAAHESVILSSFAPRPVRFVLPNGRALRLDPNTIVARTIR